MNHREILHAFDQIEKPSVSVFAACCTSEKAPKTVAEIRNCIKSNEVDCTKFESAFDSLRTPAEEPKPPKPTKPPKGE